jgi:hypothetical protein
MRRNRTVEQMVKHEFRWMIFWRLMGDLCDVPPKLFGLLSGVSLAIGNIFTMFSRSLLYYELEHARKYRILTDTDLALAIGEPGRYGGIRPGRADAIQDAMHRQGMEMFGDESD